MKEIISVVVPVYKGEPFVKELVERIRKAILSVSAEYEIILVNDASPDNSWEEIKKVSKKDQAVKGLNFSRNFGQHHAITAGLDMTSGQWIIIMDCDLQDIPEEIPNLYHKANEGFDIVFAKRVSRNDNLLKRFLSIFFYRILGYLTETKQDYTVANYGIYNSLSINALKQLTETSRNFNTLIRWVGFKSTAIEVKHGKRMVGKTSYSLNKSFKLALDTIISFSNKPLILTIKFGFLISFSSFIVGIYYLVLYINDKISVLGYTSLIVSIWFLSGLIIMVFGITGLYIGKIFDNVKNRPIYIIKDRIGF